VVEVSHGCNVVAAHLHCLALEDWEEGLEGIVYCGDFKKVDVVLLVCSLLRYGSESSSLPPEPVREALVLNRTLHGCRFAKLPFHVDRQWRQSLRSKIIAVNSGTKLFQFDLWAKSWYALSRRSLPGRMALVNVTVTYPYYSPQCSGPGSVL